MSPCRAYQLDNIVTIGAVRVYQRDFSTLIPHPLSLRGAHTFPLASPPQYDNRFICIWTFVTLSHHTYIIGNMNVWSDFVLLSRSISQHPL